MAYFPIAQLPHAVHNFMFVSEFAKYAISDYQLLHANSRCRL